MFVRVVGRGKSAEGMEGNPGAPESGSMFQNVKQTQDFTQVLKEFHSGNCGKSYTKKYV